MHLLLILMLPHAKSIRNWTSSLNGKPGFLKEVLDSLQTLNENDKHCTIAFDAMFIRKQIIWNDKNNKFLGYCDFENKLDIEGNETLATEVQAELVKTALTLTHNAGLKVLGVVCDGAYTNT
ncbi:uncharacterized protein LOC113555793 [Rhopalosiphum maidis]|uniref:uncharacterized protein LOC113555793 n=1 Tax=Rhopalosiphum maidis TaxID=43146 RepID=UPI000F009EA7|nr:uncharacterized protein LOC113555793 [Rhopalosiphum maidis]